jgi:hypothetical protein
MNAMVVARLFRKWSRALRWSPVTRGHQRRRRLDFVASIRNHGQNQGVDFRRVAAGRSGGRFHNIIRDILEDKIFGLGNVFERFRH